MRGVTARTTTRQAYTRRDSKASQATTGGSAIRIHAIRLRCGPRMARHRPYLTAWVDVRSGIFVGWYISFGGNSSQNSIWRCGAGAWRMGCRITMHMWITAASI